MLLQINKFGDFDELHTECILESPNQDSDIKSLLEEFGSEYVFIKDRYPHFKIKKDGIEGVKKNSTYTDLLIEFLIKKGFKKVKTISISIGD